MMYEPGMDLSRYLEDYRYFPKLTDSYLHSLAMPLWKLLNVRSVEKL